MAKTNATLIWNIANLLRGPYQPNQYGDVILPFTILRRLDAILAPTKDQVLAEYEKIQGLGVDPGIVLKNKFNLPFFNTSKYTFASLAANAEEVAANLIDYIEHFSPNIRDVFEGFSLPTLVMELEKKNRLYDIVKEFANVDLHPDVVSGHDMGYIFEELIRKFAESNNAQAGDHFTPREVIALMVDILFAEKDAELTKPGIIREIYDPAAGTGGMLSVAYDHLTKMNPNANPVLYGQEINARSYAMCKSDMIVKGQGVDNIYLGDTLTDDGFSGRHFDFLISNPPFGVSWNTQQAPVTAEHEERGHAGRFGPGLPRVSDGSLLFLMHLISKMRPVHGPNDKGSRLAIVLNGSPLFSGGAGSGESSIRQWIIENDLLDAVIALPTDMFYNTGISTYIWILDNSKPAERQGKVQLIDSSGMFGKMRKSLGSKRKELRDEDIQAVAQLYADFTNDSGTNGSPSISKTLANNEFGYSTIIVERPLQLRFEVTVDKIDEALAVKSVARLKESEQVAFRNALSSMTGQVWNDRAEFLPELKKALYVSGIKKPGAALMKTLWLTIGEPDPEAKICTNAKGQPEPDPSLRDSENVPLTQDIQGYFEREILPHVPDAWIDTEKTKIGYEIPFTRHFYRYAPPRPLDEIQRDLRVLVTEIQAMLAEVGA
ncbi:type I restriction-modification system subunit M [Rhodococcus sp. 3-2]|uniref:type I restriction-modification system subunit M n=1 Tax=Rhodococcus sp. 3-2 TaxID=2890836 RepID=UPI001D17E5AA|nr:class I SAM-dependent DNA methyltransferase [Rhodococcus sp. 3-2]MCC4306788.1 type I restriction-modification system subunit M [Rhodococcus sp. 3-2]